MRFNSSNPVLTNNDAFQQFYGGDVAKSDVTTLSGVVNKTGILVMIAVIAGGGGYWAAMNIPGFMMISGIAAFILALGMFFVLRGKPQWAPVIAPLYAVVEGAFLGSFTAIADNMLAAKSVAVAGGVAVQAFIVTIAAMVSMLVLYRAGIIKPTRRFKAVLGVLTMGIMLSYVVSFALSFFWKPLPLISFASAVNDTGMMGFIGLGINILILGVASLWLVIDFEQVEKSVAAEAPKYMEWYCGFALLVTLAWIYFEAVKLVVRLAILFGNRD